MPQPPVPNARASRAAEAAAWAGIVLVFISLGFRSIIGAGAVPDFPAQAARALPAAVLWAPAAACLVRWFRGRSGGAGLSALALVAATGLAPAWALTQPGADYGVASSALMAAVLINAACLAALPPGGAAGRARNVALALAWLVCLAAGIFKVPSAGTPESGPRAEARPPLALVPEEAETRGFQRDAAPALDGRDGLPAYGTWSRAGAGSTGAFVSAPIETGFPLVQIRVCGELRPPASSLVLRTESGAEIPPLTPVVSAEARWRIVNFPAPRGAFRVVARVSDPAVWLAFTAPVELGRFPWIAGKLVRAWSWILACGLALLGAAAALRGGGGAEGEGVPWRFVPWLALASLALFFAAHIDPTAGPNDSGGYLDSARLLSEGRLSAAPPMLFGKSAGETDISKYLPSTFTATPDGRMAPTYPVGFPMIVCAVSWLLPLRVAVPTVILIELLLGVAFTLLLARALGFSGGWAWFAAGIAGLSPVYLFEALQPVSDGPALVWVTAAVYLAWTSAEKPWRAVPAGLATALAVLIRPSDLLCVVPLLVCLAGRWRQLALWALAGLPGALWQAYYNHALYGHALLTGYGDVLGGFAPHFFPLTLGSYARWLPLFFTPLVAFVWLGPFVRGLSPRARWVLASWAGVFALFYAFYWCTYDNWYNMRFLLPAAPAFVLLSLAVLRRASERWNARLFREGAPIRTAAVVVLLLGLLVAEGGRRGVFYWIRANHMPALAGDWARAHLPPNAVVFAKHATGALAFYTDLTVVRSDCPEARSMDFFERIARTGRPIYAVTYHWETPGHQWPAWGSGYPGLPGHWEKLYATPNGEIFAWKWHPLTAR